MIYLVVAGAAASTAYMWIFILVGIITLLGAGGLLGIYKWAKNQGARDANIDKLVSALPQILQVVDVVLGDGKSVKSLNQRLDAQDKKLADIEREQKPHVDVALRTERKVDDLVSKVDVHIGQSEAIHDEIRRRLTAAEKIPS